jgi:ergothioneine biosynthesis protein EgtB
MFEILVQLFNFRCQGNVFRGQGSLLTGLAVLDNVMDRKALAKKHEESRMSVIDKIVPPSSAPERVGELRAALLAYYRHVRSRTEKLASPISPEDAQVQPMTDASPTKWHLGHTSWFFETFLLSDLAGHQPMNPHYKVIFNSYYNAVGEQHPRPRRGMLCRPSLAEVMDYRRWIDEKMARLLEHAPESALQEKAHLIELGLNHEEQHQELLLTDILNVFASDPLLPAYSEKVPPSSREPSPLNWHGYDEGIVWIGHEGEGFAFDNESPRHRQFVHAFRLASRPVTVGEFVAFIEDGGYERPELWLSDGWATVQEQGWGAPLYWMRRDGEWWRMTLSGMVPVDPNLPVCHVSFYEADAFARWAGARLPTEAEWEVAAVEVPEGGNFLESGALTPLSPADSGGGHPQQMFGDVWEWTASAYSAYPGFAPAQGALGEYNSKFMCNQMVLRGGSAVSPAGHIRLTYRNFFPPGARWQFMGFRLAK